MLHRKFCMISRSFFDLCYTSVNVRRGGWTCPTWSISAKNVSNSVSVSCTHEQLAFVKVHRGPVLKIFDLPCHCCYWGSIPLTTYRLTYPKSIFHQWSVADLPVGGFFFNRIFLYMSPSLSWQIPTTGWATNRLATSEPWAEIVDSG